MDDQGHGLLAGASPVQPEDQEYQPDEILTAWSIVKRRHRATCRFVAHPLGVEVRMALDDYVLRTEVIREFPRSGKLPLAAIMLAVEWFDRYVA